MITIALNFSVTNYNMINLKETKRIKAALHEHPNDYQSIIEDTTLAICITNQAGNFVAVNDNYTQLYGFSKEELVGQSFTKVVPPDSRDNLKKYHDRFFVDKYEILRRWVVQNKAGEPMEIFADAGYSDQIEGAPHKVTLIQFESKLTERGKDSGDFANQRVG